MAAPIYALALPRPAVVKQDRVAVIPAAIYVTYTLCGDELCLRENIPKVKKTAGCGGVLALSETCGLPMLHRAKDKPLIVL